MAWVSRLKIRTTHCLTASGNPSNFLIGGPGNLGGLYNNQANYSSNVSPDFVAKLAFEPGFGHYEIFGVGSDFRSRIYPNATAPRLRQPVRSTTPSGPAASAATPAGCSTRSTSKWALTSWAARV